MYYMCRWYQCNYIFADCADVVHADLCIADLNAYRACSCRSVDAYLPITYANVTNADVYLPMCICLIVYADVYLPIMPISSMPTYVLPIRMHIVLVYADSLLCICRLHVPMLPMPMCICRSCRFHPCRLRYCRFECRSVDAYLPITCADVVHADLYLPMCICRCVYADVYLAIMPI